MRRTFSALLITVLLIGASVPLWAAVAGEPERTVAQETQRSWSEAKLALKRGAYEDALPFLERILTLTPNDPWAQLYRSLCELRLEAPPLFAPISQADLTGLKARLQEEERARRRFLAQQKAIERLIRQEQAKWDQELDTLEKQAQLQEKRKRDQAQKETLSRARAELSEKRRPLERKILPRGSGAGEEAGQAPEGKRKPESERVERVDKEKPVDTLIPVGGEAKKEGVSALPRADSGRTSVELSPVVVSGELPEAEPTIATPSLAGRTPPPAGAVQINARQMSVSPERKLALAEGDVEVVFEDILLTCDRMTLFTDTKDVYAEGRVRLEQGNEVFRGEMVHYNFLTKKGRFLQGTVGSPPWYEHGRSVEQLAEGVFEATPGYLTSCEFEPPHFKFYGRSAVFFRDDRFARAHNVAFFVEKMPLLYLPWASFRQRQTPFFIVPGKRKPWGEFALMGYRYEIAGPLDQGGALRLDWRRNFLWGEGIDHRFDSQELGKGLFKAYHNKNPNMTRQPSDRPKGGGRDRYRILWRHNWEPLPHTTLITDIQEFSDVDFRKEFLFREEYTSDEEPESFISLVTNDPNFTLTALARKRMNRFQTMNEALPQLTFDVRDQRIGETWFFSQSHLDIANLQTKRAHSDKDDDVFRTDWFQQLSYALNWFRPIELTPRAGIRQTFYTKDIQGTDRQGQRDLFSGQASAGADASLKLFRVFPVTTNVLGLDLHWLRHVLTPTVSYSYLRPATVPDGLLNFAAAPAATNQFLFGLENKLQTKRAEANGKPRNVDLARALVSLPYTFRGNNKKEGGRFGNWAFDVELYPWPWLRLESDWVITSHLPKRTQDARATSWNLDCIIVGGRGKPEAALMRNIQVPEPHLFEPGTQPTTSLLLPLQGQWYLGLGHRYSQNDKTESVLEYNWRLSEKWELGSFHRITWKELASGQKRFGHLREYQYSLRRDLHDWIGEVAWRVDREFGEEIFFTLTLKAYPEMPIDFSDSYHQPKIGSQSSPFSPLQRN